MEKDKTAAVNSCTKCDQLDDDHMVMCDKCDKWYHYACVGVDSNVADYSWNCDICEHTPSVTAAPNHTVGFETIPSSSSSPVIIPLTTPAPLVVTATGSTIPSTSTYATTTAISANPVEPPVTTQIQNGVTSNISVTSEYGVINKPLSTGNIMTTAGIFPATTTPAIFNTTAPTYSYKTQPTSMPNNFQQQQMQKMLQLERLEEERRIQQEFLERKYKILSENCSQSTEQTNFYDYNLNHQITAQMPSGSSTTNSALAFNTPEICPTPSQLAARRSLPRELPTFSGDPEEWPIFITSFQNTTAVAGFSNVENLIRLQGSLKGKARELVKSKLLLPSLVPDIIQTLRLYFGRPEHILERVISKARNMPCPRDKLELIIEFALSVQNICATMESCGLESHLNNPMLVKELVDKLSNQHKLNWAMYQRDEQIPIVKSFSVWLYQIAEAASKVVTPNFGKGNASLNTHIQINSTTNKLCPVCKLGAHKVHQCNNFNDLPLNQKWDFVKHNNLCRHCLNQHKGKCHKIKECGISGCKYKHHPLLHKVTNTENHSTSQTVSTNEIDNIQRNVQINTHQYDGEDKPLFRILPIRINLKNTIINTFAFLDEGSSVTLVDQRIFGSIPLDGIPEPLCLQWTGGKTREENDSVRTSLIVSNIQNNLQFELLNVHTIKHLDLPSQSINMSVMTKMFPYLKNLPIQSYNNARPMILIGANNWKLAVPLKVREGGWQQPIATKTRLGWAIQGGKTNNSTQHLLNIHTCACQKRNEELHELAKTYFNIETPASTTLLSAEDSRAMEILKSTYKHIDERYEVGLMWKNSYKQLPNSYDNAFRRLICLHKNFVKDKTLHEKMQTQIKNLIDKGYAKKLSPAEIEMPTERVWYLPIFLTFNPNKPTKIRLVWDAAAKSDGASLNDFLLSGPDLLNPLIDILLAFRIGRIAICGDIAEMFHRINVRESDMHAQRFLWRDKNDKLHQPSHYVMRALTFGLNCAPCIAHFVRDTNAENFKLQFPRAVDSIQKHHYVDDLIDSEDTVEEAISLANQVMKIHATAGFRIRNWASNSAEVLNQLSDIPKESQDAKLWGATEKVLGMYWDPVNDVFKYICRFPRLRRNVIDEDNVPTKRECLQILMSIFDPLGFLSCHTIGLKILLQDVWRSCIGWDEPLSESLNEKWCQWKATIPLITNVEIPRCYSPVLNVAEKIQLHTFVDAGEYAYSAVCYLLVQTGGIVSVTLIASKAKVAPLKPLSTPRMELQAALIGIRLANKIKQVRRLRISSSSSYWWSDSKTVLQWLRIDPRNFQQFVMHRVGEILEHSNANQWRWVPTKINPADFATKITTRRDLSLWFDGPTFLRDSQWPKCEDLGPGDTSEFRRHVLVIDRKSKSYDYLNYEYFSNWKRLYRAVATFILYVNKLKSAIKKLDFPTKITYDMIQRAQRFIIKTIQQSEFHEEMVCMKNGESVEKSSKLYRLNTYLDDYGIIRCQSRAKRLNNHDDEILLPFNHQVTLLIVRSFHEDYHHQFHEAVINRIKSQYVIFRLRVLYKKVRRSCQKCKNYAAVPQPPQMALLPPARLGAFQRPFTFVGIDYFGPLLVAIGRRRKKRWGVVFTCLTVRAIHIEISHSLDTSSCILCIRNFIARRGVPREIYTDNGTNFKGAERVLNEMVKNINLSDISFSFEKTKWIFNPPGAPHMGGAWERLIRSVKNVLYVLYPSLNFNDETLKNAMCEIESIINSRLLTFVSIEHEDDDAITPNHLLLGSCDGYKPFFEDNNNLHQRWHKTKLFADHFWQRWLKEYVPIISRRSKWFAKVPPVSIGSIVIVVDENLPRRCWPKGKVTDAVVARDGQVRRVTIKTQFGVMQRPVTKVAVLNVGNDHEQARIP